ncbi:hypothetical protein JCM10207_008536 [Rhodosporidiobolus poonsookiae]
MASTAATHDDPADPINEGPPQPVDDYYAPPLFDSKTPIPGCKSGALAVAKKIIEVFWTGPFAPAVSRTEWSTRRQAVLSNLASVLTDAGDSEEHVEWWATQIAGVNLSLVEPLSLPGLEKGQLHPVVSHLFACRTPGVLDEWVKNHGDAYWVRAPPHPYRKAAARKGSAGHQDPARIAEARRKMQALTANDFRASTYQPAPEIVVPLSISAGTAVPVAPYGSLTAVSPDQAPLTADGKYDTLAPILLAGEPTLQQLRPGDVIKRLEQFDTAYVLAAPTAPQEVPKKDQVITIDDDEGDWTDVDSPAKNTAPRRTPAPPPPIGGRGNLFSQDAQSTSQALRPHQTTAFIPQSQRQDFLASYTIPRRLPQEAQEAFDSLGFPLTMPAPATFSLIDPSKTVFVSKILGAAPITPRLVLNPAVVERRARVEAFRSLKDLPKSDARRTSNIVATVLCTENSRVDELEAMKLALGEFVELEDVRDYLPPSAFKAVGNTEEERVYSVAQIKKQQRERKPFTQKSDVLRMLRLLQVIDKRLFFRMDAGTPRPFDNYEHCIGFLDQLAADESYTVGFIIVAHPDGLVASLKDAGWHDPVFNQVSRSFHTESLPAPSIASSDMSSFAGYGMQRAPSTGKAPRGPTGGRKPSACRRWNQNHHHPQDDCEFTHKCMYCSAKHKGVDCAPSLLAGVGPAPRIQRRFHYPPPAAAPPRTPLLSSTGAPRQEHSAPVAPLPAASYSLDRGLCIDDTLRRFPEHFRFERTIDDVRLQQLLNGHPQPGLIRSFVVRFRSRGFEPPHNGSEPAGNNPTTLRFPANLAHRRFIADTVDSEIAKGWIGPASAFPLPAVTYNSTFVVESDAHRLRVAGDHSSSGLNDGIDLEECPTVYDTIVNFLRLLRWRHFHGLIGDNTVLWKLDVSSAFKLFVMLPRWQARQGIAVMREGDDGRWFKTFHIERRGVFGCRAMQFLWTRFMSLLMWAAQVHYGIDHPLAFMDDAYGADSSGTRVPFLHSDGALHFLPRDQASMASLWRSLGIPFKLTDQKAPHGRCIAITGLVIDLDTCTASLPANALARLVTELSTFLATPSCAPSLQKWRQVAGWLSWALNVAPKARPFLTPVYNKLRTSDGALKVRRNEGVFINVAVRTSLTSLITILEHNPRLDACLANDDGTGAGLGFHFSTGGRRFLFYSRPQRSFRKIQFAETLALVCGLETVLGLGIVSPLRRYLARTDSSAAVYALDTGAADDTEALPLRTLTLKVYALAQAHRFNFRALHVASKDNALADRLSRWKVEDLRRLYGADLFDFSSSMPCPAPARLRAPIDATRIVRFRNNLARRALEPRTREAYARSLRRWTTFTIACNLDWYPTAATLSMFVAWRLESVKTVYQTLSGLAYTFEPLMGAAWSEARSARIVRDVITGGAKMWRSPAVRAVPLPFAIADFAVKAAVSAATLSFDDLLAVTLIAVGFMTCACLAELTAPTTVRHRDSGKYLLRDDLVTPTADSFRIRLRYSKTDRTYAGAWLRGHAAFANPVWLALLRRYLRARDALFPPRSGRSNPFLFVCRSGMVPTRAWAVTALRCLCGPACTGHSLRAGGATYYATVKRWPPDVIMRHGRWSSSAWELYVRVSPDVATALAIAHAK